MGMKAIIGILIIWAFSFLMFDTSLSVLPYWITSNTNLHLILLIIVNVGFAFAFVKYGLDK